MQSVKKRLLLPFTHKINTRALDYAIALAKRQDAMLIALALIQEPEGTNKEPRYEQISQANDFLVAIAQKAARHEVTIERYQVRTDKTVESIITLAQQLWCEGVILLVSDRDGILLDTNTIMGLLKEENCKWYLIHVPVAPSFWKWVGKWIQRQDQGQLIIGAKGSIVEA